MVYKTKHLVGYLLVSLVFITSACEIINPDEPIPSYIHIDKFTLVDNPDIIEGSLSHKITDAWVYVDDDLIGAFELPVTFPVLADGKHKITVCAGIKLNGIAATRVKYPFYQKFETTLTLIKDSIITLNPVTSYYSNLTFKWKESFEDAGVTLQKTASSDTVIMQTSDTSEVFEGTYSGKIVLDGPNMVYEIESNTDPDFVLPKGGAYVFLELDYKTNSEINVGIFANELTQIVKHNCLVLNETDTWNKIYINLSPFVSEQVNAIDYKIFFGGYTAEGDAGAVILLDNIKLIHY